MTASKTPRQGLMSPVGSDAFITADFADTFAKLDAAPGIAVVSNAASRPTTYTTAQHGSMVYQQDYNILWSWNQPTSGSVGSWRRVGNIGLLGQAFNSGSVSTTTTNYTLGPTATNIDIVIPGGRPYLVTMSWDQFGNTYDKTVMSFWEGTTKVFDKFFPGKVSPAHTANSWWTMRPAPSSQQTVSFKMTVASFNATAPNGSGTTTITGAALAVWEM